VASGMIKLFIFIIFCSLCCNGNAFSRMGKAEVRLQGNTICFTLSHEEFQRGREKMTQYGYLIEEKSNDGWKTTWGYYIKPVPFKEGECLPYGVLPEGADLLNNEKEGVKLSKTAPVLQINTLYDVDVSAKTNIDTDPTEGYGIRFCLQKHDNSVIIEQGWMENSCDEIKYKEKEH
jgi:hypothetical protein